ETDIPVTQINARDDTGGKVPIADSSQKLPDPYVIDKVPSKISANDRFQTCAREQYAIDFWESSDAMRVGVGGASSVGPQGRGDLFTVLDYQPSESENGGVLLKEDDQNGERIPFKMYDNNKARYFDVATGDTFKGPIIGHVNYGYQNYKLNVDLEV